ncbi:hypothetical protein CASFOL_013637 [Castilleja foliolosa]|uniref:Peptidase A1 domain-containing protein n=1 Tax=Castilleja foliolosa TaxID=1961234 RepID=A0ABD3DL81_9LAMI
MAYNYLLFAFLFFTIHILSASTNITTTKLALKLIHRHSIFSLSYTPKPGLSDSTIDDIRAPAIPDEDGSAFLVNISIGEPPVPQLMAMDTGSHLIWVHCTTCKGCNNIFDPKKSSTYTKLSGDLPLCHNFVYVHQHFLDCPYEIRYMDQSMSKGVLALEKFTFITSSGGTMEINDVVFGCAQETSGPIGNLNGVFGLEAPNKYHLAARAGNKFSYCIGNLSDTHYMYNHLILGDGAVIQGDSTPMQVNNRGYFVTLEGISVGDTNLKFNPYEFYSNVNIDSGSTITQLVRSAYEPLMAEVKKLVDKFAKRGSVRNAENRLCYYGNLERDLKGFPIVTLHLAEGTDIFLDVEAMFQRSTDGLAFCMSVVESRDNMIGVRAQQFYNVGFDLNAKRVSFQKIDCELLED